MYEYNNGRVNENKACNGKSRSVARGSAGIGDKRTLALVSMEAIKTERQNGDLRNIDGVKKKSCRAIIRKEEVRWTILSCLFVA